MIWKISDVIRTSSDISLFTRELEIEVGGLFFWELRLSGLENHNIDCEGLRLFIEKLKAFDQTARLLQTIFLIDKKYYLYCYRYQNDIFGVFLKQKRGSG